MNNRPNKVLEQRKTMQMKKTSYELEAGDEKKIK